MAPVISEATEYIFPAFMERNVRRVANGMLVLQTDTYYKAVESVVLAQYGDFFVLAIMATVHKEGTTLARVFIQNATKEVARTCYKIRFKAVLQMNLKWAPWYVLVVRQLPVEDPNMDEFGTEEHARNILFGCKAHTNLLCDRAPLIVRALLRPLVECYSDGEAERLRALVIQRVSTRDCTGVLANKRLLSAFFSAI